MVVLNKIYTRTGDDGSTALGNGERVNKTSVRVEAYGTVDETNATIGLVRRYLATNGGDERMAMLDSALARIQNDLFDLGADLCVPERMDGKPEEFPALRITQAQVDRLESEIDTMNAELEPLRSFVLPGGTDAAAGLHLARTVCRRAERCMVALALDPEETVSDAAMKYVNRLSDYFFVASRFANDCGRGDVLWVPGKNQ